MSEDQIMLSRRQFLNKAGRTVTSAAFVPTALTLTAKCFANTQDEDEYIKYDFIMPRVKFKSDRGDNDVWNVRPGGDANLLEKFSSVIRCKVKPIKQANNWEPQYAADGQLNAVVTFNQPDQLKKYPFLFMTDENHYQLNDQEKNNLEEYIKRGGFLLMDDCVVGNGGDFFYKSSFKILEEIFGAGAVKSIPKEHEIFHNVYDLGETGLPHLSRQLIGPQFRRQIRSALPYMHGQNYGARGVFVGERLAVFLSSTDIHCGWCDREGREFGRENHEKAIQMGINIIMYALTH